MLIHGELSFKAQARRWLWQILQHVVKEIDEENLKSSAVIFAPHADDETLGCGGTIIKKRKLGARVDITFMTDGANSHKRFIAKEELKAIRQIEALAASKKLGVDENHVFFLEFEDGKLADHHEAARAKVTRLLNFLKPQAVFIPYCQEPPLDHLATNQIVIAALQAYGKNVTVYEYPIWFWHHWPWTGAAANGWREIGRFVLRSLISGYRLTTQFRYGTSIQEFLETKRAALNEHKSQTTKLRPVAEWKTLDEVANGELLPCFFQPQEIFRQFSFTA
jgi:LmbE family N-acetylglucosaminyl deacetylase